MKKLITLLVVLAAVRGFAGDVREVVKFGPFSNISTNPGVVSTNAPDGDKFYYGDFAGLYVDFSGASSPTVTVALVTVGDTGTGPTRTLFSAQLTGDTWIPVRELVKNTANAAATDAWAMIPVYQDRLRFRYATANKTNVNVTAWAYFK